MKRSESIATLAKAIVAANAEVQHAIKDSRNPHFQSDFASLHAIIDTYRDASGRWVHHGPEFRRRESRWPEYDAAVRWERRNLARLIRSAREGTTLRVRAEDLAVPAELAEVRPPRGAARQHLLPF